MYICIICTFVKNLSCNVQQYNRKQIDLSIYKYRNRYATIAFEIGEGFD